MRDILSRTGVGTSEFFLDRIGRLKIYLDRIGIGLVASIFFGSDRSTQKKIGSDRDRIG